jgi:hypothetical protein
MNKYQGGFFFKKKKNNYNVYLDQDSYRLIIESFILIYSISIKSYFDHLSKKSISSFKN